MAKQIIVNSENKSIDVNIDARSNIELVVSRAVSQTGVQNIVGGADISVSNVAGNVTVSFAPNGFTSTGNIAAPYFIGNVVGNISGNIVVPGLNTDVLYNNNGSVGANDSFQYNAANTTLTLSGNIVATNISGNGSGLTSITGANVTGTVANATYATTAGSATTATSATTAGTVTTAAQPNITSVGTLTSLDVTANVTAGNIKSDNLLYANGSPYQFTTNAAGTNTQVQFNDSNSFGGNSSFTFNKTTGLVTATGFSGNGAQLTSIAGANVTGTVANATHAATSAVANSVAGANVSGQVANALVAGTVYTNAQPNITSVGTLSGLSIAGDIIPTTDIAYDLGNATNRFRDIYLSGNTIYLGSAEITADGTDIVLPNANISGDINTTGNANITQNLNVTGNAVITGNLTVDGNTYYTNVETLVVEDPIIEQGGGPNGAPLTSNDGKDRGELLHYYTTEPVDAFMGWDNSGDEFIFGSNVTNTNEVISVTTYGNIRAQHIFATIDGANVLGEVANATYATNAGTADIAYSVDGANVTGEVASANFASEAGLAGLASQAYSVDGANVVGEVANATYATNAGSADTASVASEAYSVDVGNVVGIGDIATINLNMNPGTVLFGDGVWGGIPATNPSGSNTEVQFNNDGAFGSDITFTFDSNDATLRSNNLSLQSTLRSNNVLLQSSMKIEYTSAETLTTLVPVSIENSVGPAPFDSGIELSQGKISLATSYYDGISDVTNNVNILSNPDIYGSYNIILPPSGPDNYNQTLMVADPSTGYLFWGTPTPINSEISKPINLDVLEGTNGVTVVPGAGTAGEITLYFTSAEDRDSIASFGSPQSVTVAEYPSTGEYTQFILQDLTDVGDFFLKYNYSISYQYFDTIGPVGYVVFVYPALEANKLNSQLDDTHIQGGTTGQVLSTDGTGTLSWIDAGGTPSGSNTQVQFNDDGAFGANANLTFNKTNGTLSATRLVSTVATGTAPFTVTSTTLVPNLYVEKSNTITYVSDTSTNASFPMAFIGTGSNTIRTDTGATYNPSTGNLTIFGVVGRFFGAANTVTTAAQPNITSVGSTLTASTSIKTGNIVAYSGGITAMQLRYGGVDGAVGITSDLTIGVSGFGNLSLSTPNPNISCTTGNLSILPAGNLILGSNAKVKITGGSSGQVLSTDGLGNLSWTTGGGGGGGTPGGANTQLQFNNDGAFGGISTVTYDGTNLSLGSVDTVKMTGGSSNLFVRTDGTGNLSFQAITSNLTVGTRTVATNIGITNYTMNVEARSGNVVVNVN